MADGSSEFGSIIIAGVDLSAQAHCLALGPCQNLPCIAGGLGLNDLSGYSLEFILELFLFFQF